MDNSFQNLASTVLQKVYAAMIFILARVHQERGGRGMGYKHCKAPHD